MRDFSFLELSTLWQAPNSFFKNRLPEFESLDSKTGLIHLAKSTEKKFSGLGNRILWLIFQNS